MEIRVRFAPSPTGYLHVGGLRTALYNYLFAKKNNGKMILRIEDTDRTRLVANAQENLIDALKWAGIDYDEGPDSPGNYGPYVQSERLEIYKKYALELVDKGKAYYAFDTTVEIDAMRKASSETFGAKYNRYAMRNSFTLGEIETQKLLDSNSDYVIRLFVPFNEEVIFADRIRGEVRVSTNDIDDQVLLKSDGFPTYHLANVVDDHLMKISHVIRGEEWLPSTPKHVLLYQYFSWQVPEFAHLPLLLNKDKSKLSKRQGSVAVEDFRDKGYLRDAFVNFIALLGWNPFADREIYNINELIEFFNLDKVNKGGAVFDTQKLDWMNQQYLKSANADDFITEISDIIYKKFGKVFSDDYLKKIFNLFKERITFVSQIPEIAEYMFTDIKEYDLDYMKKRWLDDSESLMLQLIEKYNTIDSFTHDDISNITKDFANHNGKKLGDIIHPIRLMITGIASGASMFHTMEILGKNNCIDRMKLFLNSKPYSNNG
ncbi:MAG: glutamate--tRNA ligase [Candidatus Kapabacteria bacterium]|nr:glutamate--tRNA ligase [Ignavibacteriota bacterium]MCW5885692.1 glutamate--tRNA ligase [Candidatus Kapabacteria bacterium]